MKTITFAYFSFAVVLLGLSVLLFYPANCLPAVPEKNGLYQQTCTGIAALYMRDQLPYSTLRLPYLNYPFEYFFLSFPIQSLVNLIGLTSQQLPLAILSSNLLMSLFAILCLLIYYKMKIPPKRIFLLMMIVPVTYLFGLSFDYLQALLLLLSAYYLQRRHPTKSAVLFGLSCGLKLYPILFMPFYLKEARNYNISRLRFCILSLCSVGLGVFIEVATNPINFLTSLHYTSSYGIEGNNILGFIFPKSIISYNVSTWILHTSTSVAVRPYEVVSGALILLSIFLIYRSELSIYDKILLGFFVMILFLYESTPQMLLDCVVFAPPSMKILNNKFSYVWFWLAGFFGANMFLLLTPLRVIGVYYMQGYVQLFIALVILSYLLTKALLLTKESGLSNEEGRRSFYHQGQK